MSNEGGHYCSKKSDDICGNVCGQVNFFSLFKFICLYCFEEFLYKTNNPIDSYDYFGFWGNVREAINLKMLDLDSLLLFLDMLDGDYVLFSKFVQLVRFFRHYLLIVIRGVVDSSRPIQFMK